MPVEELVQRISTPFLSLYLIVCCVSDGAPAITANTSAGLALHGLCRSLAALQTSRNRDSSGCLVHCRSGCTLLQYSTLADAAGHVGWRFPRGPYDCWITELDTLRCLPRELLTLSWSDGRTTAIARMQLGLFLAQESRYVALSSAAVLTFRWPKGWVSRVSAVRELKLRSGLANGPV